MPAVLRSDGTGLATSVELRGNSILFKFLIPGEEMLFAGNIYWKRRLFRSRYFFAVS